MMMNANEENDDNQNNHNGGCRTDVGALGTVGAGAVAGDFSRA